METTGSLASPLLQKKTRLIRQGGLGFAVINSNSTPKRSRSKMNRMIAAARSSG